MYFDGRIFKRRFNILLLEDEPVLRHMLSLVLERSGYRVLTAGSVEDAETVLRAMGAAWIDLVLSDANLSRNPSVLDGYRFHAEWQARYPVPPFVFMLGSGGNPAAAAEERRFPPCGEFGSQGGPRISHVLKPFQPASLLALIRGMLME